jgi:3-oxoacyl-[acyl-carrier protein] reductase
LAEDKIRVNTVLPGAILTDRLRQVIAGQAQRQGRSDEDVRRTWEEEIPLGCLGESEDIADMIVFLASERANYVTGVTVQVDGGGVRSMI